MSVLTRWLAAGLLLIPALLLFHVLANTPAPHHPLNTGCADCHLYGNATTNETAYQLIRDQEALCGGCHPDALTVAHPSGITVQRPLPDDYPLDWKGDLTCSSCHRIHDHQAGHLRGEKRFRAFCHSCHEADFFERMADGGLSLQHGGHLAAKTIELPVEIDPYSLHCLGCHSDNMQVSRSAQQEQGVLRHAGSALSHPIGVLYAGTAGNTRYHPQSRLAEVILLPEGRVSCVSCHEGYSEQHGALVMSNRGSALCLECHNL